MPKTLEENVIAQNREAPWILAGKLARVICSDDFPTGDRAALRRMTPGDDPPLQFYRFFFRRLGDDHLDDLEQWKTICAGIAIMAPHAHNPNINAGRALAEAGYSEQRLERLLAAKDETRDTLLLRAARFLAAKGGAVNWGDFAWLIMAKSDGQVEKAKRKIAMGFYRALDSNKNKK
jgi:CRISPR system Cascade subunit CasB